MDWLIIAQAVALFLIMPLLLRLVSFRRAQRLLSRFSTAPCVSDSAQFDDAKRIAYLVNRIAGWQLPPSNCLKRSLVLWTLLRWRGIDSALRIGVRKTGGKFEAHAWVEWEGQALGERPEFVAQFAAFTGDLSKFAQHSQMKLPKLTHDQSS